MKSIIALMAMFIIVSVAHVQASEQVASIADNAVEELKKEFDRGLTTTDIYPRTSGYVVLQHHTRDLIATIVTYCYL